MVPGIAFLLSDTHGATWRMGAMLPTGTANTSAGGEAMVRPSELMAVALRNGSLLLNMRTTLGRRALARSDDGA